MGRSPCCSKEGLNRGAWTAMEDKILTDYIQLHGEGKWRNLPKRAGLKRCGKSCRLRWLNYLRPDIKRGNITNDEEELIIRLHNLLGNRWSLIAGRLPGRTDNEIKNYWNTNICKRIQSSHLNNAKTTCRIRNPKTSEAPQLEPSDRLASQTEPCIASDDSRVLVRTTATRCSKVVLFPRDQPITVVDDQPEPAAVAADPTAVNGGTHGQPLMISSSDSDHSREDFFSDFLDIDCLQYFSDYCFGDNIDDHAILFDEENNNKIMMSTDNNSDESSHVTNLLSQDMLIGVDHLPTSLIDPDDFLF